MYIDAFKRVLSQRLNCLRRMCVCRRQCGWVKDILKIFVYIWCEMTTEDKQTVDRCVFSSGRIEVTFSHLQTTFTCATCHICLRFWTGFNKHYSELSLLLRWYHQGHTFCPVNKVSFTERASNVIPLYIGGSTPALPFHACVVFHFQGWLMWPK